MPGSHRWSRDAKPRKASAPRPQEAEDVTQAHGEPRGINRRFVRKQPDGKGGTTFVDIDEGEELDWSDEEAKIGECKAGTLVLIHGSVLHQSKMNLSDKSR